MNLRILPFLAALSLLSASCTSGTEGIFASIEREQKIVSLGGLSKTATITSMAESGGKYYATGGKALFSRSTTGTSWDKSTVGGSSEVVSVGAFGSNVFAVAGGKLWTSADGATWSDITPSGLTAYSLVPIIDDDGFSIPELALVTDASGDKKTVYHVTANTVPSEAINLATSVAMPSLSAEVTSIAKVGTVYYLASASFLWHVSAADWGSATTTKVSAAPNKEYAGLLAVTGTPTRLFLTTRDGSLYAWDTPSGTAASFTALRSDLEVDSGHKTWLHTMLYNAPNDSVWIATGAAESSTGKEGNGYVEWNGSSLLTTPNTTANNYTSSVLPTSALGTLFRGSSLEYFAGTVAHGLWKWNSTDKTWSQQ